MLQIEFYAIMNTDNINNFVDETFTKVKLASANPLKKLKVDG